jgi:hypothetical protein
MPRRDFLFRKKGEYRVSKKQKPTTKEHPSLAEAGKELVVKDPGTSGETLRQRQMKIAYEIESDYRKAKAEYDKYKEQIRELLKGGADVEEGPYGVKYGIRRTRRVKYKEIVIDLKGEEYQKALLNQQRPYAHFIVRLTKK